ncbi:DinB family protein [Methylopila turkensis]|nr:DinB family protein [Methylopila turkensis]
MMKRWIMFGDYNTWANRRLYAAVAALPPTDFGRDGGAFFRSLRGTLNHILVADRIWLGRFEGEPASDLKLDQILHDDLGDLTAAREAEDERLRAFVGGLDEKDAERTIVYRRQTSPEEIRQPLEFALAHLFNHQTHHRGQAHALLTQFGGPDAGPALDLAFFQRGL